VVAMSKVKWCKFSLVLFIVEAFLIVDVQGTCTCNLFTNTATKIGEQSHKMKSSCDEFFLLDL